VQKNFGMPFSATANWR